MISEFRIWIVIVIVCKLQTSSTNPDCRCWLARSKVLCSIIYPATIFDKKLSNTSFPWNCSPFVPVLQLSKCVEHSHISHFSFTTVLLNSKVFSAGKEHTPGCCVFNTRTRHDLQGQVVPRFAVGRINLNAFSRGVNLLQIVVLLSFGAGKEVDIWGFGLALK